MLHINFLLVVLSCSVQPSSLAKDCTSSSYIFCACCCFSDSCLSAVRNLLNLSVRCRIYTSHSSPNASFLRLFHSFPCIYYTTFSLFCQYLSEVLGYSVYIILQDHHDLAVCYAMKEEICRLYTLKDYDEAVKGWTDWFEAAKESEIPALVKFAEQKEKRLPGLAAHAIYPISTGKLEGFNNKITPSYPQCCKYSYPHAQQPLICLNEE